MTELENLTPNPSPKTEIPPSIPPAIDPSFLKLAEMIKDGILEHQKKDVEALKIELKDRQCLTILFIGAIIIVILAIAWLTATGKFEPSTMAFLLGTAIGSLLTILGKLFTIPGE